MNIDTLSSYDESDLIFRRLEANDYNKGYFKLLSQLTTAPEPSYASFQRRLTEITQRNTEQIFIVEYIPESIIIATITCFAEYKLIHNLGKVCHVEDFVIDSSFRNKKLGSKLLDLVKEYAVIEDCYKIILDCSDTVAPFYIKNGYEKKNNGMALYFEH